MEEKKKKFEHDAHEHEGCGCGDKGCGCGNHEVKKEAKVEEVDWQSIAKYKAAELDNYIKRNREAVNVAYNDGRASVIMNILPLGDSLSEAMRQIQSEADKRGIEILIRKFGALLEGLGLEEIAVNVGDPFDPYIHSSIGASEDGKNIVSAVYQKGYKFAGRILRPATVKL